MKETIQIALPPAQRDVLVEHGPYTLRPDGVIVDREGITLTNTRPTPAAEETEWDRAVVAALNAIAGAS